MNIFIKIKLLKIEQIQGHNTFNLKKDGKDDFIRLKDVLTDLVVIIKLIDKEDTISNLVMKAKKGIFYFKLLRNIINLAPSINSFKSRFDKRNNTAAIVQT